MLDPHPQAPSANEKHLGTIHIVFGPQGAGKSTYARQLATRVEGVRLSIDEWMHQLYGPDLPKPMSFSWIMARVQRCEQRVWATAADIARTGSNVILDPGFMKVKNRSAFLLLPEGAGLPSQLHFVHASHGVRRERVLARNVEQGETFSFAVTPQMFDFMEREFETATAQELASAIVFASTS